MKRFFFEKLFAGVLASLSLFAFISCGEDAGLGSTVDTLPPELSISYPPDDAYVKGSFVFAGTCSDDKGVTRIEVSVKKLEKDGSTKDYGTSLATIKDSLTWSMEVNKSTDTGFELPDGIYKLEVTAWDRSGRKSGTIPRQFQIDNTPPVFVITKPGVNRKTFLSENSISKYGSLFAIEGTIADDHSIASMDITIYDKDGNLVAEPYSEKDISTTGGTSVTIARYIEGGIDESNIRYNEIYNVGTADVFGNKIYSCTITIADSTKEYKNPGDGGVEGGNSTSVVYLYDDIYEDYMSAKKGAGLSANDFRSVLNGTATDASLAGKGIATDVTVEKVRAALNKFAKDTTNMEDDSLSFSLNPNADPTYKISGFNLNYNEAGTAISAGTNKAMGEQPLTIIVSAGLDQVNIDPKSLKVYIKKIIDADKAHITKDTLNKSIANLVTKVSELEIDLANANESSDSSAQKEAEAQLSVIDGWNLLLDNSQDSSPSESTVTLTTKLPASNYIEANAYYAIVVTGCDKDGIKLSQTENYGFIGTVSAVPPSASFTSPKDLAYFANSKYIEGSETDKLVFTGTATENNAGMTLREITATLTVSDESSGKELPGSIQVTITGDSDNQWTEAGGLSCVYDEQTHTNLWTFIPSLCGEAYQKIMAVTEGLMYLYNVNIKVTGTSALSYEMSRSVHIDTTKPVVQITSVSPLVYGKEYFGEDSQYKDYTFINSSILIQGSINEVNLENVTYDVRASEDLTADLSDEKYSVLGEIKEFYTKLGVENSIDGKLGKIRTLDKKIRTDLVTNYFLATGKITKDQPIKARVVFRAIDNVGNVGEYNSIESNDGEDFYIYQETNRPKVTLGNAELSYKDGETQKSLSVDTEGLNKNNLTYEHNLFGTTNNNKLSVSFSDDDSVVEYEIFIAEDGKDFKKDENGREIPFYTATPNKTSASVNCTLPENEGVYKVKILARDFIRSDAMTDENEPYGVKEIGPFYIAVDSGAPSLSLSNPQNGAFVSRNSGIDGGVKGTVSKKGTKISGFIYQLGDKKKTPLVELTDAVIDEETPVNEVYNWTGKIATMPEEGTNFKLEITSIDAYGQSSTIIANLGIDEEAPTIKLNPDEDENFTGSKKILESNSNYNVKEIEGVKVNRYLVSGSWCDEKTVVNGETTELIQGTGTSELYYAYATEVENGEPKWYATQTVAGTAKSTAETTFNIYIPLTEGANFAYKVWGKDAAGNTTTPSEEAGTLVKGIMVDLGKPAIEKTAPASVPQYVKNGETLTITGKAEDSYGLNEIIAKVKLDGADIASGKKGYTFTKTIAEDKKSGTFTIQIESGDTNNGAWTFEIHATDLAGRESGTLNYNTVVDTKKPEWDEASFKVNKAPYVSGENHTWYKASSLPFAGKYSEEGSGIDYVEYTVIKAGETTGTTDSFGTTKETDSSGKIEESFSVNLGEFIAKMNGGEAVPNKVTFFAVDNAGNKSEETTVEIYIDTEAPLIDELSRSGSQFSNKKLPITVTGKASDDASGIEGITLKVILEETGEEQKTVNAVSSDNYKNWSAEIPKDFLEDLLDKTYVVKAVVNDKAKNQTNMTIFRIDVDTENPSIKNISLSNTNTKYSVHKSEAGKYYVHNKDENTFSIYGSIQDSKSGIQKIELCNGETVLKEVVSLPIENIEFTEESGSIEYTIKATDNAGNVTAQPITICFDNTPPKGIHAIDGSNKDIFFRISNLDNWKWNGKENADSEGEIADWDDDLDKDIGGKYSPTSFGNNQTVRVRGNISDKDSGVNTIYYKVVNTGTVELPQQDSEDGNKTGLDTMAAEFLQNYKTDNNGYFSTNKIENKRITYTSIGEQDKIYDTNGDHVLLRGTDGNGAGTIFEGYVSTFGTCKVPSKRYATITTNYDQSFTGFKNGYNYLILVAVDNVGNASLDSVNVVTGVDQKTLYTNFSLNVDTETPELKATERNGQPLSSTDLTLLTNGNADITVGGTFDDNFSTVKTVVIEVIDDNTKKLVTKADGTENEYAKITLSYNSATKPEADPPLGVFNKDAKTWSATIKKEVLPQNANATYSVKATVTDRAGNESTQTIFVIQLDTEPPSFKTVTLSQNSPENSTVYQVYRPDESADLYWANPSKGTFKIDGTAIDGQGIEKVELSIPGVTLPESSVESGTFTFDNIPLSALTGNRVEATLTAKDKAGNSSLKEITINFDKVAPNGIHNVSDGKDRTFRLGEGIGEKYEPDVYGKSLTAVIRGYFEETASGLSMIYYKLLQDLPTASVAETFLGNYKDSSTGYFTPFATATTETIDGESISTNYKATIPSLQEGKNYLLLVAVDKVGNPALDTVTYTYKDSENADVTVTGCYTFNVDNKAPVVERASTEAILTAGKQDVEVKGSAYDSPTGGASGIKSIVVSLKFGDVEYKSTDTNPKITVTTDSTATGGIITTDESAINWTAKIDKSLFAPDSVTSGTYTVYASVMDNAGEDGNTQLSNVATINIDKDGPKVTLQTPSDAYKATPNVVDINKTITLSGNAEDNNPLPDETITAIQYTTNANASTTDDTGWTNLTTAEDGHAGMSQFGITGNYTFTVNGFNTEALSDNTTYYLRAKAVDKAGTPGYSNVVAVYVNQRSDRPILSFTNLTKNAAGAYILKLNDAGTVEVTVTDDDSTNEKVVKSISVQELEANGTDKGEPTSVSISTSGDFTFTPATKDDGAKYFKFTVVDNKDTSFTSLSNTIDYTTVPVLSVKGTEIAESDVATKSFTYKADNEAPVVESVYAKASNSSGTAEATESMISLAYVAGGTNRASLVLTINASDANGIAGMTAVIKKSDGTVLHSYKSTTETKLAGKDLPTTYTWTNAGTFTNPDDQKGKWVLPSLPLTGLEGTVSVIVTPYDNSGLTGNSTQQFTVDNEGPSVKIISHKYASEDENVQYNGIVELSGEAKDSNDVASVKWYIPDSSESTGWNALDKEALVWNGNVTSVAFKFDFKDTTLLDNYIANATSSGETEPKYYIIPIYFRAVDVLGNIKYTTDYSIKFNPDLDKPVAEITYPLTSATEGQITTLGGTIRMTGTAVIPEGAQSGLSVQTVYVQIGNTNTFGTADKNKAGAGSGNYGYTVVSAYDVINELDKPTTPYDSNTIPDSVVTKHGFANKDELDAWWGVKTTTTAWRLNLNENGEMNPTSSETNKVYLRVCAVNSNGKFGAWSDYQYIAITNTAPEMSGKLYQFTTSPSAENLATVTDTGNVVGEKEYVSGMFLKGQWYIETIATETTAGSNVKIDGVTKDNVPLTKGVNYFVTTDGVASSVKVYIKVDPAATKETVYKVTAIDGSDLYSAVATYAVNVDNDAPSVYALTSDYDRNNLISMTKIENSNYVYRMYGAGIDEGSKIDFLAVYFKRGSSIEIPLQTIGTKSGNETTITRGTAFSSVLNYTEDDLYGVNDSSATYTNDGTYTTISSTAVNATNSFIRAGSLVKLSGSYYEITEVGTGTAKVKATFSTAPSSAFFVAAIAVNNGTETETTSGGTSTITNDDGDGFADSLDKTSSGSFTWDLTFFSDELEDGQIDIVIVAGDKAGNYTKQISSLAGEMSSPVDKTTVMLTNHKPRVSKVFLATDLNGDKKYKEEDFAYVTTNNGVSSTAYAYSALDDGGNEQLVATLKTGTFSVRDGLAVTFEMLGASNGNAARTGGGTALYYIPKLLAKDSADLSKPATGATSSKFADMSGTEAGTINVTTAADKVASTTGFILSNTTIKATSGWDDSMENSTALDTQSVVQVTIWDDVNDKTTVGKKDVESDGKITAFGNQYTIINIPVYFDMTDNVAPKSVIDPFYWTDAEHNSLYENNSANGHIELENDWKATSAYTANEAAATKNAEFDADPKVSGKITLSGYAYDDHRLSSIWVAFDGFTPEDYLSTGGDVAASGKPSTDGTYKNEKTNADGTKIGDGKTYYQAAYYAADSGWTVAASTMETKGWKFSVTEKTDDVNEVYLSQKGHKVKWTLSINTEKCSPIVATDIKARVIAFDHQQNIVPVGSNDITTTLSNADGSDNVPWYQMDVVPYITEINTDVRTSSGLKDNNIRSASGKYSILANRSGNDISVNGFNFGTLVAKIADKATSAGTSITSTNGGTSLTITKNATTSATITNNNKMTKSGYLELFSNGIRALNNINNNNAHGAFALSGADDASGYKTPTINDYKNMPNRAKEADYNETKNVTLTDDRYFRFFDMHKTGTKNGYYPVMIMDGDDPVFGFVDSNGDSRGTITNGWANYYMPQRVKYSGSTGTASSYEYLCGATTWEQMAMAKDDSGRYVHTSVYNRTGGGMEFFYDRFGALNLRYANGSYDDYVGWARGVLLGNDDERYARTYTSGNTALCMDGLDYNGLLVDRYQSIKLLAKGNSRSSSGAIIYQAYYDDNSSEILFRNFKIGTSASLGNSMTDRMQANQKASDGQNFTQYTNLAEISGKDEAAPGRNAVTSTGSKYYDFGIITENKGTGNEKNYAVFVYYDFEKGRLRLMYSATSAAANSTAKVVDGNPTNSVVFCENTGIKLPDYVGQYVSMCIDDSNHIHIAAFDANNSDLKYIYIDSYNATSYTDMTVDAAGSVGNWTSIKIDSTEGHTYYNKPVIAYYNATETGGRDAIKVAFANNVAGSVTAGIDPKTNYTSTGWEYMTVPSVDPAQGGSQKFQQVCLDFDRAGRPVVGYLATNLEFGKWLDE